MLKNNIKTLINFDKKKIAIVLNYFLISLNIFHLTKKHIFEIIVNHHKINEQFQSKDNKFGQ